MHVGQRCRGTYVEPLGACGAQVAIGSASGSDVVMPLDVKCFIASRLVAYAASGDVSSSSSVGTEEFHNPAHVSPVVKPTVPSHQLAAVKCSCYCHDLGG
jgi:hypothetical protein